MNIRDISRVNKMNLHFSGKCRYNDLKFIKRIHDNRSFFRICPYN